MRVCIDLVATPVVTSTSIYQSPMLVAAQVWQSVWTSLDVIRRGVFKQVVMGWTDSHLHHFVDAPIVYSVPSGDDYPGEERLDERRFRLADVARHEKAYLIYEYDFGDSWAHEVVVEKILSADPKKKYAVCLDGENACPPEDCGGIWGYYDLLKVLKNPKHKEHRQTLDWLGGQLHPGRFDLQKVNATLRGLEI